jgi:hypothetical protein
VNGLLVPDFVAADAHAYFGCPLNLAFFSRRSNTPVQTLMPDCSLG